MDLLSPLLFLMEGKTLMKHSEIVLRQAGSWSVVFAARLVSAARLQTFPVSYTMAAHFQNQIQEHMLAFILQPSPLCAVLPLDKLLLQVQIRE